MATPTLLELAEVGAHFGHNRSLTYPKAKEYVFTVKNGISLINLEKTQSAIDKAREMFFKALEGGKTVLIVGTKSSLRPIIQEIATEMNLPFITERWFGGTLTNFETIISNINKMNELSAYLSSEKARSLSKKQRLNQENRLAHYHRFLGGVSNLNKVPDLIVLASASADKVAINEAGQVGVPVIAICDTDVNPDQVAVAIPANDDAPKAVNLILRAITEKTAPSASKAKKAAQEPGETLEEAPKKKAPARTSTKKKATTTSSKSVKKVVKKKKEK